MIKEEILKKLPMVPDGAVEYFEQLGELDYHLLIYRVAYQTDPITELKEKSVKVVCTHCQNSFFQTYIPAGGCHQGYAPASFGFYNSETNDCVISGDHTLCPSCGAECKVVHISNFGGAYYVPNAFNFVKIDVIDNCLALLKYRFYLGYTKEGKRDIRIKALEGNLFDVKDRKRVYASVKNIGGSLCFLDKWYMTKQFRDGIGAIESSFILPFGEDLIEKSPLPHCKLDALVRELDTSYPSVYLRLYQSYPQLETLITSGASHLLHDFIDGAHETTAYYLPKTFKISRLNLNKKAKRPSELLYLNREEFRFFVKQKTPSWVVAFYSQHKNEFKKEDTIQMEKLSSASLSILNNLSRKNELSLRKTMLYLLKQDANVIEYRDYIRMKRELLEDPDFYPSCLKRAHDNVLLRYQEEKKRQTEEQKKREKLKIEEQFKLRYEELDKFSYAEGNLLIRPCKTEAELKKEGTSLHHCVYTYKSLHGSGATAILFIRKKDKPDKPFFTVELNPNSLRVVQNRGNCNCERTEEVIIFEKHWLEFIKNVMKKEKQNGKSNRSKSKQSTGA